jgi:hypothetical protein
MGLVTSMQEDFRKEIAELKSSLSRLSPVPATLPKPLFNQHVPPQQSYPLSYPLRYPQSYPQSYPQQSGTNFRCDFLGEIVRYRTRKFRKRCGTGAVKISKQSKQLSKSITVSVIG